MIVDVGNLAVVERVLGSRAPRWHVSTVDGVIVATHAAVAETSRNRDVLLDSGALELADDLHLDVVAVLCEARHVALLDGHLLQIVLLVVQGLRRIVDEIRDTVQSTNRLRVALCTKLECLVVRVLAETSFTELTRSVARIAGCVFSVGLAIGECIGDVVLHLTHVG